MHVLSRGVQGGLVELRTSRYGVVRVGNVNLEGLCACTCFPCGFRDYVLGFGIVCVHVLHVLV